MGFDFVNTRITGATGPVTVISGSVSYQALNANILVGNLNIAAGGAGRTTSGSLIVRNGLIIGALNLTSSAQSF